MDYGDAMKFGKVGKLRESTMDDLDMEESEGGPGRSNWAEQNIRIMQK